MFPLLMSLSFALLTFACGTKNDNQRNENRPEIASVEKAGAKNQPVSPQNSLGSQVQANVSLKPLLLPPMGLHSTVCNFAARGQSFAVQVEAGFVRLLDLRFQNDTCSVDQLASWTTVALGTYVDFHAALEARRIDMNFVQDGFELGIGNDRTLYRPLINLSLSPSTEKASSPVNWSSITARLLDR